MMGEQIEARLIEPCVKFQRGTRHFADTSRDNIDTGTQHAKYKQQQISINWTPSQAQRNIQSTLKEVNMRQLEEMLVNLLTEQ